MKTQPQNQTEKIPSLRMMFLEYDYFRKGQHFISVLVKTPETKLPKVVARIFREFNPELKKTIYTAKNSLGENLFSPTENLYLLKKDLKENVQQLAQEVSAAEKNVPLPEQKVEEKKPVKTFAKKVKEKAQQITQEIVPAPMTGGERPEIDIVTEQMERENELKNLRTDKGKGKSQQINR